MSHEPPIITNDTRIWLFKTNPKYYTHIMKPVEGGPIQQFIQNNSHVCVHYKPGMNDEIDCLDVSHKSYFSLSWTFCDRFLFSFSFMKFEDLLSYSSSLSLFYLVLSFYLPYPFLSSSFLFILLDLSPCSYFYSTIFYRQNTILAFQVITKNESSFAREIPLTRALNLISYYVL